ncbi:MULTISPECIES: Hint domain-containing protein [unclassified Roseovarius]|uniref:Hint domain-containing protein n=1 Tax=unclassified Roseovarius TaxID=2614913 RepID=UPI00273ED968|nr:MULTISPECIES: Hint domain-containing protein [unclassified Roseovarius]
MTMPPFPRPFMPSQSDAVRPVARPLHDVDPEARKSLVMRKFRVSSLTRGGDIYETDQIGPATPLFEAAFSAFAHGTLIKTDEGQVAVEDLQPGTNILTTEYGALPLLWIGSMTLMPREDDGTQPPVQLTRIMADSFGPARPAQDLMAGPGARLLTRRTEIHDIVGTEQVLSPARDMVDGVHVINIAPPRPVTVYHLCLQRHATITAAGLSAETFHPGPGFERALGPNMLSLFLSFFPHIHVPSDFGPLAYPRASANGVSELEAG